MPESDQNLGGAPRAEYARRLEERRAAAAARRRIESILSNARILTFVAAGAIAWLAFGLHALSTGWLAAPATVFAALIVAHERVIRARRRFERAAEHYERGLARIDHLWAGRGETGQRFLDEDHIFAADLDLFGTGSLFERICTARTRAGEQTLADWLHASAPPKPDEVRARQAAVEELRGRLDLREDLALLGADVRSGVHPEALAAWGQAPRLLPAWRGGLGRAAPAILAALVFATLAGVVARAAGLAGPVPLAAALVVEMLVALSLRSPVRKVIVAVERAGRDLSLLSQVLVRLEAERFVAPRLAALRAALDTGGLSPSRQIARLGRLVDLLDARRNQLFALVAWVLLWATQLAHAIESWRRTSGPGVGRWLEAVGEMEALCALAGWAYENPADPFPEIVEREVALFDGEGLGHPLLARERCVVNDVRLGGDDPRVLIVSGSNMSGKSTLLRTVGINTVLAMAGAPVRATRLRCSPLVLGASIRIQDSLQAGTSRFYAEITRLRRIVDRTKGTAPVLFLIDEMLHGTNSHDRKIGAEAVVRGLVERGAIGMITTHDLALAHIAEALGPRAANVHFEDHLEDGRMTFDYVMRPGVVEKSNALALMRSVGLDLPP